MTQFAVNGAAGHMGRRIIKLLIGDDEAELVAAVERSDHPAQNKDVGLLVGSAEIGVKLQATIDQHADVMLDFSTPSATAKRMEECEKYGIGMVVGTTGLAPEQIHTIENKLPDKVPVLRASNMSVGINLVFSLLDSMAQALGTNYDIEIVEAHHRRKKDAPSGTANHMAEIICEARGWEPQETIRYGRQGLAGPREPAELGMHSIRGGDIVGDHTIIFAGAGERVELTHRATNRDVFASGAVKAGHFLAGQKPGLYNMKDVLGL
ncbi:MAG: 4-hydroxy-tetrahydrodipicolinate reductase [Candidatus Brocadiia bacterium]